MVLEVKVFFDEIEDAHEFQKFLRKHNCPSRVITEPFEKMEIEFEGTIAAYRKLIDTLTSKDIEEESAKNPEFSHSLKALEEFVEERVSYITEFYANHSIGDVVSLPNIRDINADTNDIDSMTEEMCDEVLRKLGERIRASAPLFDLKDDGIIEPCDDDDESGKYTFVQKKPIEEIVLTHNSLHIRDFEPDDVVNSGLISTAIKSLYHTYCVVASPEIIFIDIDECMEFLHDCPSFYEKDDSNVDESLENILQMRQILIHGIFGLISSGSTAAEEILEGLEQGKISIDKSHKIIVSTDLAYLQGVLADMKKLGLISTKGGKLKVQQ